MRRWRWILFFTIGVALSWPCGEAVSRDLTSDKVPDQTLPPKAEGRTGGNGPPGPAKEALEKKPYTALVEKNIFSPDRKEFPLPMSPSSPLAGPVKKPPARPQVILYGITLAGDYQSATLIQPGRALRKGEREMLTLKVGDQLGEYRLSRILADRIVLESEEDRFEVFLDDPTRPKTRTAIRTETKPATVTSAIPGAPPVEASRPAPSGAEPPRPAQPPPTPSPERVVSPPMPAPGTPPSFTPSPSPVPQPSPTTPTSPPPFMPRRRIPVPPASSPEAAPQMPGTGGPGGAP